MARGDIFRQVAQHRPNSNNFDLSYDHKLSLDMGKLVPVHITECLPGDRWNIKPSCMVRLAPMLAPVMHKVKVDIHFFFVPHRLVWDNWPTFISGDNLTYSDPPFADPPAFPYIDFSVPQAASTLPDYLGLPLDDVNGEVSAIPFAAYQCIYSEFYRDENLIAPPDYQLANGSNNANYGTNLAPIRYRAWQHDYFTSALPWAQKGDPISVPGGDVVLKQSLPSYAKPTLVNIDGTVQAADVYTVQARNPGGGIIPGNMAFIERVNATGTPLVKEQYFDPNGTLASAAISINDLRRAEALQVWLEANARGGTRYTESILMHFGVKNPDARLQRPEFIGGISNPVVISEVLQSSATTAEGSDTPQGNMSGHGISAGSGGRLSYFCQEHGYMIGIMSVMPTTAYQQGIPRHWSKFDKFLHGWPELANLGEQEILNKELYVTNSAADNDPFGYTPRYAEYKYQDNRVSGAFRTSLDYWHMGRIFTSAPALNEDFVSADPTKRIFAVELQDNDSLYAHVFFDINCRRMLPRFGIPTL